MNRLYHILFLTLVIQTPATWAQQYDLLLKSGHVIDPANGIDRVMDVAIAGGKVAAVQDRIEERDARQVLAVAGRYVIPGLIDLHTHVFITGRSATVLPDDAVLPHGTTTVVDAGVSGWKNFDAFKSTVIDRAQVRVLALLNIVGGGMNDDIRKEDIVEDMEPEKTAAKVKQHPGLLVGVKTAHYGGFGFVAVERAIRAGTIANVPVMLDSSVFSTSGRNTADKVLKYMRPGDLHTHTYNDHQLELINRFNGKVQPWMWEARKRGVLFDLGHGGGSFLWPIAHAAISQGFPPDTISTDLHTGSILMLQVNMLNAMSKLMNLGMPLREAVERSTVNPAKAIRKFPELGTLSAGAVADIAVIEEQSGVFAYIDSLHKKLTGTKRVAGVMTIRAGQVVYDRDGLALAPAGNTPWLAALPQSPPPASRPEEPGEIYDLLLKGGEVIDPASKRFGRFSIAISGKTIRKIAPSIAASRARLTVDLEGYYVTPGLIDSGFDAAFVDSPSGIQPDHHSLPGGVTTVVTRSASAADIRRSRVHVIPSALEIPAQALTSGLNRTTVLQGASLPATMTLLLNQGVPLGQLVDRATRLPAAALARPDLGTLREGGPADIAVFAVRQGEGFLPGPDGKRHLIGARVEGVLTVLGGEVVWDLHGLSMREWTQAGGYWSFR